MFDKSKQIVMGIVIFCVFVSFNGCNLMKSPISMVKNRPLLWLSVSPGKWYNDDFTIPSPTWKRLIEEYRYFADYNSSNWSAEKLTKQWYFHLVSYTTKFNNTVTDEILGGFIINGKKTVPVKDALLYFKEGIKLSESRTYGGISVIYSAQDKARIQEVITTLESGNVTDISFSNGSAVLRWITNKLGDEDYGEKVAFLGTYIIADVKLKKDDGTESTYKRFAFYTTPDEPIDPYQYDKPYYHYK